MGFVVVRIGSRMAGRMRRLRDPEHGQHTARKNCLATRADTHEATYDGVEFSLLSERCTRRKSKVVQRLRRSRKVCRVIHGVSVLILPTPKRKDPASSSLYYDQLSRCQTMSVSLLCIWRSRCGAGRELLRRLRCPRLGPRTNGRMVRGPDAITSDPRGQGRV